jgi:superfamily II DNA helicase RecQ
VSKVTGTATAKVVSDIRDILRLDVNNAPCIKGTFNRSNISYEGSFSLISDWLEEKLCNSHLLFLLHVDACSSF